MQDFKILGGPKIDYGPPRPIKDKVAGNQSRAGQHKEKNKNPIFITYYTSAAPRIRQARKDQNLTRMHKNTTKNTR